MNKQLWEPKAEVFGCIWQRSGSSISLFPVSFLLTDISLYLWTVFVLRNCLITICKLKEGWLKWIRETRFCVLFLLLTLFFVSIYLFIYIVLFLIFFWNEMLSKPHFFFSKKGFCLQNRLIVKSPFLCCVSFFLSQIGTSLKKTKNHLVSPQCLVHHESLFNTYRMTWLSFCRGIVQLYWQWIVFLGLKEIVLSTVSLFFCRQEDLVAS